MPTYYFWEKGNVSPLNFEPGITENVNQVAHGFELPPNGFIPVYDNSGTWTNAIASATSTYHQAIIVSITDVDNFVIQRNGYANITNHGLAINRDYYLSDNDSGQIQMIPSTNLVKCILPVTADYIYIYNVAYPRVKNALNIDSTTGQIKLGGLMTENTTIDGFSTGVFYNLDIFPNDFTVNTVNSIFLASTNDIEITSGDRLEASGTDVDIEASTSFQAVVNSSASGDLDILNLGSGNLEIRAASGFAALSAANGGVRLVDANVGSSATVGDVWTLIDAATGEGEYQAPATPVAGDMSVFQAYKSGLQTVTGTWADITSWTQGADTDTSIFSFNTTTGELTVNEDGLLLISLDAYYNATITNRTEGWIGLSIDTGSGYSRSDRHTFPGYVIRSSGNVNQGGRGSSMIVPVSNGDKFKMQARCQVNSAELDTDTARFYAVLLTGAKGDEGAPGGSTVQDNTFRIQNVTDNTKQIAFAASGISTGTTRTITMPDEDVDLSNLFDSGTYTGASSYDSNLTGTANSRKDGADEIYINGSFSVTGAISSGSTLFQISDTPSATRYFSVVVGLGGSTFASTAASCDSTGNVAVYFGLSSGNTVDFSGSNFYGA